MVFRAVSDTFADHPLRRYGNPDSAFKRWYFSSRCGCRSCDTRRLCERLAWDGRILRERSKERVADVDEQVDFLSTYD